MNVRTLCLAILYEGPASGYEIRKLSMDETHKFAHFVDASYAAIYPALNKLEEEGLISGRVEHQEGKPAKRVYEITEAGRKEFVRSISQMPEADKFKSEFLLMATHAEILPPRLIREAIEHRIASLREKVQALEECDTCACSPGSRFVLAYGLVMTRTSLAFLEEHRAMLEDVAGAAVEQDTPDRTEAAE